MPLPVFVCNGCQVGRRSALEISKKEVLPDKPTVEARLLAEQDYYLKGQNPTEGGSRVAMTVLRATDTTANCLLQGTTVAGLRAVVLFR